MFKKIRIRLDNEKYAEDIKICWALIRHRPFAKWRISEHNTTFWLTKKEAEEYYNLSTQYINGKKDNQEVTGERLERMNKNIPEI